MAVLVIPTSQTLASYRERVQLDGDAYELHIRWNSCAAAWFVDIFDDDGNPLVYGRKCLIDTRLTGQHQHIPNLPPGEITCFDTTQRKERPGLRDFGTRVLALYFDQEATEGLEAV